MALTVSKSAISDDHLPSTGDGMGAYLLVDTMTGATEFRTGSYTPDPYSRCGPMFFPAGYSIGGGPSRPYGVIQSLAMEIYLWPYVTNELARFPCAESAIEHAYAMISGGTIRKKTETVTYVDNVLTEGYTPVTTTSNITGSIGIAGLFDEAGTITPYFLGPIENSGTLDIGGIIDIADQVKLMRRWSRGNSIGFTWLVAPSSLSVEPADAATESSLIGMQASSSISNSSGMWQGSATCSYIEWTPGFGWSNCGLQLSSHSVLAPMPGPIPPRMD